MSSPTRYLIFFQLFFTFFDQYTLPYDSEEKINRKGGGRDLYAVKKCNKIETKQTFIFVIFCFNFPYLIFY